MNKGKEKVPRITVVLDEQNDEYVRDHNRQKGDLSKIINKALDSLRTGGIKVDEAQIAEDGTLEIPEKIRTILGLKPGDKIELFGKKGTKDLIIRKAQE